ncbi:MAG TPA: phosphatidate cytidylyltransferase, partial [Chromatiales bacterium]|nr:phosphatidate cytidylyltransferase [Chromatiales bacterium]HEX23183.1 phosphatidate cytidylyltransferase [Chromatiales bacterium]
MLRQRILTALVLVPLVVWGIIALPSTWLALLFGLFVAQGGWEWSRLMRLESSGVRLAYVALVLTGMIGGWYLFI